MPNNEMDYSLIHRTPDGNGKILVTTPGSPDKGSWETEAELKTYVNQDTVMKTDIVQSLGQQVDKVPSNKVVDDAINAINTRVTNIEETLMGENEITVQYPDDGNYPSLMPNRVPARALKFAEVPTIKGKTRAWNQMIPALTASNFTTGGIYYSTLSNDSDGNLVATSYNGIDITCDCPFVAGRKYLLCVRLKVSISGTIAFFADSTNLWTPDIASANTYYNLITILSPNANTSKFRIVKGMSEGGTVTVNEWFVRGVTSILSDWSSSDITTANIPLMVQQIPDLLKYNAYDAGSLVDTVVSGVESVGVNIWDEEWEEGTIDGGGNPYPSSSCFRSKKYIPVVFGKTYYFKGNATTYNYLKVFQYDSDKVKITDDTVSINDTLTLQTNTAFMKFRTGASSTYNNDIQICDDSLPSSIKTVYHPYKTDTLSLPETVTLRSAGSVADELDVESGVVTRKVGVVDLGTIDWEKVESSITYFRSSGIGDSLKSGAARTVKMVCAKYINIADGRAIVEVPDKAVYNVDSGVPCVSVRDDFYSSASAFKTAMSGVYLTYELATPTTESIDPVPDNTILTEGGGTIDTIQDQTPIIDNCLDVTYDIIPQ